MQLAVGARRVAGRPGRGRRRSTRCSCQLTERLRRPALDARRRRRPDRVRPRTTAQSRFLDQGDVLRLDEHEFAVAARREPMSLRTVHAGGHAVPRRRGADARPTGSRWSSRSRWSRSSDAQRSSAWCAPVRAGRHRSPPALAGWAVARNGLRPVRRLTADVERHRPHRGPDAAAGRGRRRGRPAGDGVQPDAHLARRLPGPAAAAGRRRRPRAADAADLAAHQHRPAHPGRRDGSGPGAARPAPAPSCSTTSAPRSRS